MKKMTWALWSMMILLFLGMGTARAQVSVTPALNPSNGTVAPGTTLTVTNVADEAFEMAAMVFVLWTDKATVELTGTIEELSAYMNPDDMPSSWTLASGCQLAMYSEGDLYSLPLSIPTDAAGEVTIRARYAMIGAADMALSFGSEASFTYTVAGEVEKLEAPVFSPAGGAVAAGTPVAITGYDDVNSDNTFIVCYVVDGTDADLEFTEVGDDLYNKSYNQPIKIFKGQTIKARTVEYLGFDIIRMSDIVTETYTVIGGDVEDKSTPTLTLSATELAIAEKGGSAVFSCTLDMREYADRTKLGFAIDNEKTTKGDLAKLEYQVGAEADPAAWIEWPAADFESLGNAPIAANPGNTDNSNKRLLNVEKDKKLTVWYRVTLVADKTGDLVAPVLHFIARPASEAGYWSATEADIASAKCTVLVPGPELEFTPRVETGLTIVAGASTELWIRPADKNKQTEIFYRVLTEDGADQNAPVTDADKQIAWSTLGGGDWKPIKVTEAMVKDGKFTVKAAARKNGQMFASVTKTYNVTVMREDLPVKMTVSPTVPEMEVGEQYVLTVNSERVDETLAETTAAAIRINANEVFENIEYAIVEKGAAVSDWKSIMDDFDGTFDLDGLTIGQMLESDFKLRLTLKRKFITDDPDLYIGLMQPEAGMEAMAYGKVTVLSTVVRRAAEDPTFSPAPGYMAKGGKVTLACTTDGAEIRYTLDGSAPTAAHGMLYGDEITIDKLTTIKAIAIKNGKTSFVSEGVYSVVGIPEIAVAPGRVVIGSPDTIRMTNTLEAKVYYTTDGSEPTAESTEYTGPFTLDETVKAVKAIAILGEDKSPVVTADYVMIPALPTVTPGKGTVDFGTKVEIACATQGEDVKIYYSYGIGSYDELSSTTGTLYTGPIELKESGILKAVAYYKATKGNILSVKYVVSLAQPEFDVKPGEVPAGTRIALKSKNKDANPNSKYDYHIYYTTDGSEPTAGVKGHGTEYTTPIEVTGDMTIKAIAWCMQTTMLKSAVSEATYSLAETVAKPTFNPAEGKVEKGTKVEIACATEGAKVYYTVDGSEPTAESTEYKAAIEINEAMTIKAIAIKGKVKSEVATAAYTIKIETPVDTVAAPTFNPAAGEVEKGTKVEIACTTEGAKVYYTVDGSEPTAESAEYKEAVVINEALTIKAIAVKGDAKSEVSEASYTVKTANEALELAGVSVYPNPSSGAFTLDLPVAATVEVFASNGVLRQRVEAGAGVLTLNIDRSGIYFLRITAEGRATVKRVVVR